MHVPSVSSPLDTLLVNKSFRRHACAQKVSTHPSPDSTNSRAKQEIQHIIRVQPHHIHIKQTKHEPIKTSSYNVVNETFPFSSMWGAEINKLFRIDERGKL